MKLEMYIARSDCIKKRPFRFYKIIYSAVKNDNSIILSKKKNLNELTEAQKEYQKYLKTKHWLELRKKKLDSVEHKCELCYSSKRLQIHHKTYIRKGNELLNDLIVLCSRCHSKFHNKVK